MTFLDGVQQRQVHGLFVLGEVAWVPVISVNHFMRI